MIDCGQGDGEGRPTGQLGHLVAGGRGRQSGGVFMSSQVEFAFLFFLVTFYHGPVSTGNDRIRQ